MDVNAESSSGSLLQRTFCILLQRLGYLGCEVKPRIGSFSKHQGHWARTEFRNTSEKPGRTKGAKCDRNGRKTYVF